MSARSEPGLRAPQSRTDAGSPSADLVLLPRVAYRGREISGARLGGVLALLAGDLSRGCGTGRLVAGLWPDERPENPAKALQILISRARGQLGADLIARTPTGYRLTLRADQVDAAAVLACVASATDRARAGDPAGALRHAEIGLAHFAGPPVGADVPAEPLSGAVDPLSALRRERAATYRELARIRALALSRLGQAAEAVGPLTELASRHPRDEEILRELLRSEAATAGPAAALERYEAYRLALRDRLGADPGEALRAAHRELLNAAAPAVRRGVPHEPNPLLGRADDIAAVVDLLRGSRVVSIIGPGGLGKTRLAYAASRVAEQPVVHVVPLAGITAAADVAAEVAASLGVGDTARTAVGRRSDRPDPAAGIAAMLGAGPALLVLDNCEHVLAGAADLVRALVALTREVRVLTTSRAPLGLSAEAVYLLPELGLPTAVELFGQRARAVRTGVDLPDDAVRELCSHLDGLPLAVELAAARTRVMSVPELTRRLTDRFAVLRGAPRDAPDRHRTLGAVVDWSWNLLDPAGQAAMRALSIFPDGFSSDAARHVLDDRDDVLAVLENLVDQSLVKVVDTVSGTRFRMLETVREFSAARRDAAGETERTIDAFLGWAADFGLAHQGRLLGPGPLPALERVRAEQDNLLLALRYGLARDDAAAMVAIAAPLAELWTIESSYARLNDLVADTGRLLSHYRPDPRHVEATRQVAVLCVSFVMSILGPRAVRAMVTLRRLPPADPASLGGATAIVMNAARDDPAALLALCDSGEPLVAGVANGIASYLWETSYDPDRALAAARRMARLVTTDVSLWLGALGHARVAELHLQREEAAEARDCLLTALPALERMEMTADLTGLRVWLALASVRLGDLAEAERWLAGTESTGADNNGPGYPLSVRAELLLAQGDVAAGLESWRRVVAAIRDRDDEVVPGISGAVNPWAVEAQAATVVAHARHGRSELVAPLVTELSDQLTAMLDHPLESPPPYVLELRLCGLFTVSLGLVDLARAESTGDERAIRSGIRLVALAQRLGYPRNFPTLSAETARQAAERADRPAYDDAVSSYAGLDGDRLRAAALAALRDRP
ncbi:BTAD domain-containing putative transcriptional regulator [Plantactinospora siamensis]|uniref:BTAD domain-containing putative transcriptional regulator n=1 Tax=Plantactinospora siamensis TaxID=555372 RepID=A0ABV6NTF8_9ACTN